MIMAALWLPCIQMQVSMMSSHDTFANDLTDHLSDDGCLVSLVAPLGAAGAELADEDLPCGPCPQADGGGRGDPVRGDPVRGGKGDRVQKKAKVCEICPATLTLGSKSPFCEVHKRTYDSLMRQAKAQDKRNKDDGQQSQVAYVKDVRKKSEFVELMNTFERECPGTGSAGSHRLMRRARSHGC